MENYSSTNNREYPNNLSFPLTREFRPLIFLVFSLLILALPVTSVNAADIENGQTLHNENCLRCHQPELYQKDERKVKNLKHLRSQVLFCEVSNDLDWFDEEIDDVTEYLNVTYYLFGIK